MPVTKQTYLQEMQQRTKACISRYEQLRMVNDDKMAQILGIHVVTFKRKRENPTHFTLSEIYLLSRYLKCPISELCGGETPEEIMGKYIATAMKNA